MGQNPWGRTNRCRDGGPLNMKTIPLWVNHSTHTRAFLNRLWGVPRVSALCETGWEPELAERSSRATWNPRRHQLDVDLRFPLSAVLSWTYVSQKHEACRGHCSDLSKTRHGGENFPSSGRLSSQGVRAADAAALGTTDRERSLPSPDSQPSPDMLRGASS